MARVQIMPLTSITIGDLTETPFVLVLDGGINAWTLANLDYIKHETGATFVMVADQLDVGTPLTLSTEQQHEILTRLGIQQHDTTPHD